MTAQITISLRKIQSPYLVTCMFEEPGAATRCFHDFEIANFFPGVPFLTLPYYLTYYNR
jgi:hypothetical protein